MVLLQRIDQELPSAQLELNAREPNNKRKVKSQVLNQIVATIYKFNILWWYKPNNDNNLEVTSSDDSISLTSLLLSKHGVDNYKKLCQYREKKVLMHQKQ